jgi:hypothetical protein
VPSESLKEQQQLLEGWQHSLPPSVNELLQGRDPEVTFGEKHGSWVLRVSWVQAEILRIADIALTNTESTPDDVTTYAFITIRSAASTNEKWVAETLYERRRTVSNLPDDFLADQLVAAVLRAIAYTLVNLTESYRTGVGSTSDATI